MFKLACLFIILLISGVFAFVFSPPDPASILIMFICVSLIGICSYYAGAYCPRCEKRDTTEECSKPSAHL